MKGKILKILVCSITIITIICCSVFGVSALDSTVQGFPLKPGQGFSRPSSEYSYYRMYEVTEEGVRNGTYWNFYGPSSADYKTDTFWFQQVGVLFPLMQPTGGYGCIIPKGSNITIFISSYMMNCLGWYFTEDNMDVGAKFTVNGLVYGTNPLSNQFSVNGKSFTAGQGSYCSLKSLGMTYLPDSNQFMFNCYVPEDICAIYITWSWETLPLTISELLAIEGDYWQNEDFLTPAVWIVCNTYGHQDFANADDVNKIESAGALENSLYDYASDSLFNNPFRFFSLGDFVNGLKFWASNLFLNLNGLQTVLSVSVVLGLLSFSIGILPTFVSKTVSIFRR